MAKAWLKDITENHILQASEFIKRVCGIPISERTMQRARIITGHLNEIELSIKLENSIGQQPEAAELKSFWKHISGRIGKDENSLCPL